MIVASSYVCDVCGTGYSGVDTARVRAAVQALKDQHANGSTDGTDRT